MVERNVFPFEYDQHEFSNGLRLISVPTPFPGSVSLQILVRAGSRNEVEEGRSGFAHFFEHMMFRGTRDYPPERYEAVLQESGAASNAYTDDDRTVYHTTIGREDFETLLAMEADRFQNLDYSLEAFQTEALAVLGEYNKDSAEPFNKLFEVLRDTAFDAHTYKHTTMGFLRDIERMPEMFDYSREFFSRFYRPEYTTLIVAGDMPPGEVRELVGRYWSGWQPRSYRCEPRREPPQQAPRQAHIPWTSHTLPYLLVAHKSPGYSDATPDHAALDLIGYLGFSQNSPLYEQLVIQEQSVDMLWASNPDHVDPYLFTIVARVKDRVELPRIQAAILSTLEEFASKPVDPAKLEQVKSHLRYSFALSLNSSEPIAATLAHYLSLAPTPETINRVYAMHESLTPADLQNAARRYLTERGRTTVTLSHGDLS